jgi:hypothetical protein
MNTAEETSSKVREGEYFYLKSLTLDDVSSAVFIIK